LGRFNGADVRELDHLTVSGDVTFGANVILRVRRREELSMCLCLCVFACLCVCLFVCLYVGVCLLGYVVATHHRLIPSLLHLYKLSLSPSLSPCWIFKGTVIIVANHGSRIDIPAGSILENKIINGDLRIMDH
jgi:UDP-N-acetylglucosamine pyrophosphorylase